MYFFRKLDSVIKMRLLVNYVYCYSFYGCILWNITNAAVESAWRAEGQGQGLPDCLALLTVLSFR